MFGLSEAEAERAVEESRSGGAGEKQETLAGARIFVLPNPSGLNASFPGFAHKLVWFQRLREFAGVT